MGWPALVGAVAMKEGLAAPDVTVRVGGPVAVHIRHEEVIIHRDSAE